MAKLNMRLYPQDEDNINILKKRLGIATNAEVVRFALNKDAKSSRGGRIGFNIEKLRDVLNKESSTFGWGTIVHDGEKITDVYFNK